MGGRPAPLSEILMGPDRPTALFVSNDMGAIALQEFMDVHRVRVPADMIAIADYDPMIDDDGDGDLHPDMLYTLTLTGRHSRGANVAFCDTHVEYAKTDSWGAPAYLFRSGGNISRPRWNNDHQPHNMVSFFP